MKSRENISQNWLPASRKEVESLGWDAPDVILFTGDAYIDHPSFGTAVIARVLESEGLRVAVVPQPNWRDDLRDFRKLGAPRLFFGVTAGNMDSMVNHYTATRRLRSDDAYSPGGVAGFRPDYPTIIYTRALKKLFPDVPVVIGGIEASMRRLMHYDYWKDTLEPSILIGSGADMLIYGMAEKAVRELAGRMKAGEKLDSINDLPQTVILRPASEPLTPLSGIKDKILHSCTEAKASRKAYAENFVLFEKTSNSRRPVRLIEPCGETLVVVNPPYPVATEEEADAIYNLPFNYAPHPRYAKKGPIPAWEMIRFSVNIHRGCFGGCSFCAIAAHQGKFVSSRSVGSIMREVERISRMDGFKGYLSDLGGPSANMYRMAGRDRERCESCARPSCIWPAVCDNLDTSHRELTSLYQKVNSLHYIKKAFVSSGVRYDMLFREYNPSAGRDEEHYLRELVTNHTSGRLKVAPEHTDDEVLYLMRKSPFRHFRKLREKFLTIISSAGLKYELIPYFISAHPGTTEQKMAGLARELKELGMHPEQVQDFTPTPMTLATAMYYLGFDPYTGKKVYVARDIAEKRKQKDYFFKSKVESRKSKVESRKSKVKSQKSKGKR
ncbi:MAG: YgiQ family radical SAM protein [Bacteroidales bacterium]|nr:YgiQ family radical SAM protein [Bacteroidales bacterium]